MQSDKSYKVFNQDCISGMRNHVESESVDLVFTDPPYGIKGDELDIHYHRDESNVVPGYVDVPLAKYEQFSREWINEIERVLRPGGSVYIVSGYTNLHHILNGLHQTKLTEVNHLIARYSFGVSTKKKFVSSHYHILFWQKPSKGKSQRTFNTNIFYSDQKDSYHDRLSVQELPRDYKPGKIKNKNQLSEKFISKFLLYSSNRGDTVLDPFCGGFTTAKTSLRFGRKFIGFELNKNAFDIFVPELDKVKSSSDPVPVTPPPEELVKRQRLRDGWKNDRLRKKMSKKNSNFSDLFN